MGPGQNDSVEFPVTMKDRKRGADLIGNIVCVPLILPLTITYRDRALGTNLSIHDMYLSTKLDPSMG